LILKFLALFSVITIYGVAFLCGTLNRNATRNDVNVDSDAAFTAGLVLGPFALIATAVRKLMQ
jgi:hypothetical protein